MDVEWENLQSFSRSMVLSTNFCILGCNLGVFLNRFARRWTLSHGCENLPEAYEI
jgi:hypothetical protein